MLVQIQLRAFIIIKMRINCKKCARFIGKKIHICKPGWNKGLTKETNEILKKQYSKPLKRNYKDCIKCNRKISFSCYNRHFKKCDGTYKEINPTEKFKVGDNKYKCPYCNVIRKKMGIGFHIWRTHTEKGKKHKTIGFKGHKPWNYKLTKETDERVRIQAENSSKNMIEICKKKKENNPKHKFFPDSTYKKLSIEQSLKNRGGRSKWFIVNGQKVQGTYEKRLAEKMNLLKIKWHKPIINTEIFKYKIDNKIRNYTPDFYLLEYNIFLKVKGYMV